MKHLNEFEYDHDECTAALLYIKTKIIVIACVQCKGLILYLTQILTWGLAWEGRERGTPLSRRWRSLFPATWLVVLIRKPFYY